VTGRTIVPMVSPQRPARWLLSLVPPTILLVAACGPVRVAGSAAPATTSPVTSAASDTPTSSPTQPAKTPGAALERWVTQILAEQYTEACLSSAPALPAGQDAESLCKQPVALASAKSLRRAWAKPGVELPPRAKVEVADVTAKGDQATVPDTAVTLDGRTLRSLELIGATGDTGSFSLSLKVEKHAGAWYVTSFDLKA
jgi:Tfp pilus assembly protein PilW